MACVGFDGWPERVNGPSGNLELLDLEDLLRTFASEILVCRLT